MIMTNGVAAGTLIVMGDRSLKPIESINAGESVLTLEGAKDVLETKIPTIALCSKATLKKYNNELIGIQISPETHFFLTPLHDWQSSFTIGFKKNMGVVLASEDEVCEYGKVFYAHPINGFERCASIKTDFGYVIFEPFGNYLVYDIVIKDINHYITSNGLVNAK